MWSFCLSLSPIYQVDFRGLKQCHQWTYFSCLFVYRYIVSSYGMLFLFSFCIAWGLNPRFLYWVTSKPFYNLIFFLTLRQGLAKLPRLALNFVSLLPQAPTVLRLQGCTTTPSLLASVVLFILHTHQTQLKQVSTCRPCVLRGIERLISNTGRPGRLCFLCQHPLLQGGVWKLCFV